MIKASIEKHVSQAKSLRHELHQIPELRFEEVKTAQVIRRRLDELGIEHIDGVEDAPTATVAMIGDPSKPCVALRADIDALPIQERTELPYQSRHPGKMHACGHDGHTAVLMGAAGVLKELESQLKVCVKLLWQPAEEGGGGADRLVKAGVLDGRIGPKVEAIFGLHGWPSFEVGHVGTRAGTMMAASDSFTAVFTGKMAHAARPHSGRDPIVAACSAVTSLQQIVSREVDPVDSAVVTVATINGGTATNIIPDTATFSGTVRTLSESTRRSVQQAMQRRCEGIALASDCTVEFTWRDGYPMTLNDPKMADYVKAVARETLGEDKYHDLPYSSMGAEDFAFYLLKVPGCFFRLGVCPPGVDNYPNLHNDRYDFGDDAIEAGVRMFVELVLNFSAD